MEARLGDIANLFDHQAGDTAAPPPSHAVAIRTQKHAHTFDARATLADAETRQALADALVARGSSGA
jgi:hypothetical protein